jgi:hypothetical protein
MLLRSKVLLNGGNLSATRLVWFYPSSMSTGRVNDLRQAWEDLFRGYFCLKKSELKSIELANTFENRPIGVVESLAPFHYYKDKLPGGAAFKPAISVDIGGGTTDIVIFEGQKPILLTSVRFAANSIFGDDYSESGAADSNQLIKKYQDHYKKLLKPIYVLDQALAQIMQNNKSEDINAFFFSIENNTIIINKSLFSYNMLLSRDEDLKILFLYFYTVIIYHIAQLMKVKKIGLPKHIFFSGTGSKILNIITSNTDTLTKLTVQIFETLFTQQFDDEGLTIKIQREIPKEVTCKGPLMMNDKALKELEIFEVDEIKTIFTCVEKKETVRLKYKDLSDEIKLEIINRVKEFNRFFLELNNKINFTKFFNANPRTLEIFKIEMDKHLRDYLEQGLKFNRNLDAISSDDEELQETLFFYPIIGTINNLLGQLSVLNPVNT